MKLLKNIYKTLLIVILIFGFSQCKTTGVVQKDLPFTVDKKTIQNWAGGKEGSAGTNIVIKGTTDSKNIYFKKIYYKNLEENIVADFNGEKYTINSNFSVIKKDLNLSSNPKEEYGNKVPDLGNSNPFDLKENEVVILYTIYGKEYFHKIVDLKQLERVYYP